MIESKRLVIKIAGESGQGINSVGEVVTKAIKKSGFCSFGYREYPSLIKGGHAFCQIDISEKPINSSSKNADVLLCFSRVSFHAYLLTLRKGGQVIHMFSGLELTSSEMQFIKEADIKMAYLPAGDLAQKAGGNAIMANVVMVGALWKHIDLSLEPISEVIREEFADKPEVVEPNLASLKAGYESNLEDLKILKINLLANEKRKHDALLSGNHLLALGAVAAGVRAYFAYPMTPSSSILSYMADIYHETGILVKQLDDEISVAQAAIGAMFMGTRALVATSGGGFDLMTESVSLASMTETPFVCVLGQRPGPATGMPTWTSASDLNLAIYCGHGEFPRLVVAASDSASVYTSIQKAFNLAEKYQLPVIVLTDKLIAESLFQVEDLADDINIERHLVDGAKLELLKPEDRFKLSKSGISARWLPGQSDACYVGNSDEHLEDGTVTEEAGPSLAMNLKRLAKIQTLLEELPEPELVGPKEAFATFIGWGSVKNAVCDVIGLWNKKYPKKIINYLHYEFIYPIRTDKFRNLISEKQPLVLVENNSFGQLGALLSQQTGYQFEEKLLKFDGRPFFVEDIFEFLEGRSWS